MGSCQGVIGIRVLVQLSKVALETWLPDQERSILRYNFALGAR